MKPGKIFLAVFLLTSMFCYSCKTKDADADIQAKISEKFAATPELNRASVLVSDGVATLSGTVENEATKAQAASVAKEINGVKLVNNQILVTPPEVAAPASTDSNLHDAVIDATKDFPGVTATVNDGEITLTGSIQRSQLTTLMQSLNSLNPKKINNQLTIK